MGPPSAIAKAGSVDRMPPVTDRPNPPWSVSGCPGGTLDTEHLTQLGGMRVLSAVQALQVIGCDLQRTMAEALANLKRYSTGLFHVNSER